MPSLVFLSYARQEAEEDKAFFDQFVADLGREIRALRGPRDGEVPLFRDVTNMDVGTQWPVELREQLRTCSCFVPVLSPTYLTRPFCGKEWSAFRARLPAGGPPPLIRPILWRPFRHMAGRPPQAVENLQWTHDSYGQRYARDGLEQLIRLNDAEYRIFLRRFTEGLLSAVSAHELRAADAIPELADLPNAFESGAALNGIPGRGPKYVEFVIVAGTSGDFQAAAIKDVPPRHGDDVLDWAPFKPDDPEVAFVRLQQVAVNEGFASEVGALPPDLEIRLRRAWSDNRIMVLVVDPWTLRLKQWRDRMSVLDEFHNVGCPIVVVWNPADRESEQVAASLSAAVKQAFPHKSAAPAGSIFRHVSGARSLQTKLRTAILDARRRIMEIGEVKRTPPEGGAGGGGAGGAPVIDGPGIVAA